MIGRKLLMVVALAACVGSAKAATVNDAITAYGGATGWPATWVYTDTDQTRVVVDAPNALGVFGTASVGDILQGQFEITALRPTIGSPFAQLGVDSIGTTNELLPTQELTGTYELEIAAVVGSTIFFKDVTIGSPQHAALTLFDASIGKLPLVTAFGPGAMLAAWREVLPGGAADPAQYSETDGSLTSAMGGSLYAVMGMAGAGTETFQNTVLSPAYLSYATAAGLTKGTQFASGLFSLNQVGPIGAQEISSLDLIPLGDGNFFGGGVSLYSSGAPAGTFPFSSVTNIQAAAMPLPSAMLGGLGLMVAVAAGHVIRRRRAA